MLGRSSDAPHLKSDLIAAEEGDVIAVFVRRNVELEGFHVPKDRVVTVVESLADDALASPDRKVVTVSEAEALIQLGVAEPVDDIAGLEIVVERWREQ